MDPLKTIFFKTYHVCIYHHGSVPAPSIENCKTTLLVLRGDVETDRILDFHSCELVCYFQCAFGGYNDNNIGFETLDQTSYESSMRGGFR